MDGKIRFSLNTIVLYGNVAIVWAWMSKYVRCPGYRANTSSQRFHSYCILRALNKYRTDTNGKKWNAHQTYRPIVMGEMEYEAIHCNASLFDRCNAQSHFSILNSNKSELFI